MNRDDRLRACLNATQYGKMPRQRANRIPASQKWQPIVNKEFSAFVGPVQANETLALSCRTSEAR